MKTTVEKLKNNFKKTIDKSQNLMYNKYVRLEREVSPPCTVYALAFNS